MRQTKGASKMPAQFSWQKGLGWILGGFVGYGIAWGLSQIPHAAEPLRCWAKSELLIFLIATQFSLWVAQRLASLGLDETANPLTNAFSFTVVAASFLALFFINLDFPDLEKSPIGKLICGLASGLTLSVMQRRIFTQVSTDLWNSYFALYVIACHFGALISQVLLGGDVTPVKHGVVNALSVLGLLLLFPRILALTKFKKSGEGTSVEVDLRLLNKAIWKPTLRRKLKFVLQFLLGLTVSFLTVLKLLSSNHYLLPKVYLYTVAGCLAVAGLTVQLLLPRAVAFFKVENLLKGQLAFILGLEMMLLHLSDAKLFFFMTTMLLGAACHALYPVLFLRATVDCEKPRPEQIELGFKQYLQAGQHVSSCGKWLRDFAIKDIAIVNLLLNFMFGSGQSTFYLLSGYSLLLFYAFKSPDKISASLVSRYQKVLIERVTLHGSALDFSPNWIKRHLSFKSFSDPISFSDPKV